METLDTLLNRELQMSLDAPASTAYLWSGTRLFDEIRRVMHTAGLWHTVVMQPDRGGLCFIAGGAMLGHLRWDGRLDVLLPAPLRDRLVAEEMAACDPDHSQSDGGAVWIVRTPADVDRAVWLLRLAYLSGGNGYLPMETCDVPDYLPA